MLPGRQREPDGEGTERRAEHPALHPQPPGPRGEPGRQRAGDRHQRAIDRDPAGVCSAAIGDPSAMAGGLNMPGGYLDDLRMTDPSMFRLEKRTDLVVPAYTGSTEVRWAKPAPEQEAEDKGGAGS